MKGKELELYFLAAKATIGKQFAAKSKEELINDLTVQTVIVKILCSRLKKHGFSVDDLKDISKDVKAAADFAAPAKFIIS